MIIILEFFVYCVCPQLSDIISISLLVVVVVVYLSERGLTSPVSPTPDTMPVLLLPLGVPEAGPMFSEPS